MRHIEKTAEPQSLSLARAALKRTPDLACDLYSLHLSADVKKDILDYCLKDQQGVCAYTGMDASGAKSHVEHLVPRSVSCPKAAPPDFEARPYQTIQWENLVACVPLNPSGWPYGADKKDQWPSDSEIDQFVSQLDQLCEQRFRYGKRGTVRPTNVNDTDARTTIEKLGLDHEYLSSARKDLIEVDKRIREPAKRRKHLAAQEDRSASQLAEFAFQRAQVLRREWAGTI